MNGIKKLVPKGIKKSVKLFLHRGDNYVCPFCNYGSKDLAIWGEYSLVSEQKQIVGGGRRYTACYKCGSTDRERLMYLFLKDKLSLFEGDKNKRILHVSPERNLTKILLEHGFSEYICGDKFMPGPYNYPSYVIDLDITAIHFEDNYFDLIICNHVLEHIENDDVAMKELHRVLKSGGTGILQVPISKNSAKTYEDFSIQDPKEREIAFGQMDHVRIYGQDYTERLSANGFDVKRVNISKDYSTQFGLNTDEDIFMVTKS